MIEKMDPIESLYRNTPDNKLILQYYVKLLFEKQHILEAKYYFDKLIEIDPSGLETNRLGFLISVRMMNQSVSRYEKNLREGGASQETLYALHLHYYYTFSDKKKMKECALGLLDIEIKDKYTYNILLETAIELKDYEIVSKIIKYILPKIEPGEELIQSFQETLLKQLKYINDNR